MFLLLFAVGCQKSIKDKRDLQQQFSEDNLVGISKTGPHATSLNTPYTYVIDIKAFSKAGKVVVTDELPDSLEYVSSQPEASVEGSVLTWNVGDLEAWEHRQFTVTVKPTKEGQHQSCAMISALPKACLISTVREAALSISKTGPASAIKGDVVPYTITVSNTGTQDARNVTVVDENPDAMSLAAGSSLTYNLGDIAPQNSKSITVYLNADQTGTHTNKATASSSNTPSVSDTAETVVHERIISIKKTGTKTQFLGKKADYTITVKNEGDVDLTRVVVSDVAPHGTVILEAPGASVEGQVATWVIDELPVGVHKNFSLTLTSRTHGELVNHASVNTSEGLYATANAPTLWKGYPALLVEVIDTQDPVLVGEMTSYIIRVFNQGSATASDVSVIADVPAEMTFVSAAGSEFTQNGNSVKFKAIPSLEAGASVQYTLDVKAKSTGDARIFVKLNSKMLKNAVTEEESTQVY